MTENGRVAGGLPVEDSKASYDCLTRRHAIGSSRVKPKTRAQSLLSICVSLCVCVHAYDVWTGNISRTIRKCVCLISVCVFLSPSRTHTHADSHMARHVNVTSFFNRSFYTHTLKNRCGWVQLSLPDESFLSLHPLISYFTRTHS